MINRQNIGNKSIDFIYDENTFNILYKYLFTKLAADKIFFITDSNVWKIYKNKIQNSALIHNTSKNDFVLKKDLALKDLTIYSSKSGKFNLFVIKAGEKFKTQTTRNSLEIEIIKRMPSRDSVLVALGGGVIGDITGLLASTIFRGLRFVQVPTTLIALVDSSIGGKNGIDLSFAKNVIGTIYQPEAIFFDLNFLQTLPEEDFINGLAEVIKTFAVYDKEAFNYMEINYRSILSRKINSLDFLIKRCIKDKYQIVKKDIEDKSIRKMLNFGHTFGHAIEIAYNFKIKHGYAVAFGMYEEAKLAAKNNILSSDDFKRLDKILLLFFGKSYKNYFKNVINFLPFLEFDKKKDASGLNFSLISRIGKSIINVRFDNDILKAQFSK